MREIRYGVAAGVATLTIDRPDKRGAMTYAMLDEFSAVDGMAVGMGAEFAAQADLRVISTRARFRWNFVHRGLVSDTGAGTWLLPRQIGMAHAMRLLYTGADLGADEALALGFATAVVEPAALPQAALDLAEAIATASPFALVGTKKLMLDGAGAPLRAHVHATRTALAECFASADHEEGVAAFLERRPARFTGH